MMNFAGLRGGAGVLQAYYGHDGRAAGYRVAAPANI